MKLFNVSVIDDAEKENVLVVAKNDKEAEQKVRDMDWACLMFLDIEEVNEVDGYEIIIKE